MIRAEELWKKIAEAWQGIDVPESASKGSKQEAAKKVEQHQTLGREKASLPLPTPPQVTASTTMAVGSKSMPSWSTPEGDNKQRGTSPHPLW